MRSTILLWTFILLLPALAVLGHDLYIVYGSDEKKIEKLESLEIDPDHFSMSDVGRLWMGYAPDSLDAVRGSVSLGMWEGVIAPLMEQTAFVVALVPLILFYIVTAILWVLGVGPFAGSVRGFKPSSSKDFGVYDKHNKGKQSYKRK